MSRYDVEALPYVSRETLDDLDFLATSLKKWTVKINLVSKSTLPELWTRHILDSVQIWPLTTVHDGVWADFGSGGGFPALPLACIAKHQVPDLRFVLVESDLRKSAFLRDMAMRLGLNAEIISDRVENCTALGAHTVSARALAPLNDLLSLAEPHMAKGGTLILPKGANHESELQQALESWTFTVQTHASLTDPAGAILHIKDLSRA